MMGTHLTPSISFVIVTMTTISWDTWHQVMILCIIYHCYHDNKLMGTHLTPSLASKFHLSLLPRHQTYGASDIQFIYHLSVLPRQHLIFSSCIICHCYQDNKLPVISLCIICHCCQDNKLKRHLLSINVLSLIVTKITNFQPTQPMYHMSLSVLPRQQT